MAPTWAVPGLFPFITLNNMPREFQSSVLPWRCRALGLSRVPPGKEGYN